MRQSVMNHTSGCEFTSNPSQIEIEQTGQRIAFYLQINIS